MLRERSCGTANSTSMIRVHLCLCFSQAQRGIRLSLLIWDRIQSGGKRGASRFTALLSSCAECVSDSLQECGAEPNIRLEVITFPPFVPRFQEQQALI